MYTEVYLHKHGSLLSIKQHGTMLHYMRFIWMPLCLPFCFC